VTDQASQNADIPSWWCRSLLQIWSLLGSIIRAHSWPSHLVARTPWFPAHVSRCQQQSGQKLWRSYTLVLVILASFQVDAPAISMLCYNTAILAFRPTAHLILSISQIRKKQRHWLGKRSAPTNEEQHFGQITLMVVGLAGPHAARSKSFPGLRVRAVYSLKQNIEVVYSLHFFEGIQQI